MVSVVKRRKGNQDYYYMYHDSKKKTRKQHEIYLGKEIPPNVEDLKKKFALDVERDEWLPVLDKIRDGYREEVKEMPKSALEKSRKEFSMRFTYNTQRIEGSTLTLKDTVLLLEDDLTPSNRPYGDIKEAKAHQNLFLDVMGHGDLSLDAVMEWHRRLFAGTKKDIAGKIRRHGVRISHSRFMPPSHDAVALLLEGFFKWYESSKETLNPVELAALVHLKFVTIHPFADGNGRISRLMMNFVLSVCDYPLLDIKYEHRRSYYTALERSQTKEDALPFLRWLMKKYAKEHSGYW